MPTASSAGLYIAQQQGFFRQAGLHVTIQNAASGEAATAKLLSGGLDILNGAYVGFILAQTHGAARFHVVADGYAGAARVDDIVVAKGSGIASPQQLTGKTIAVNALDSVAQLLVESALSAYGVKPSQVRFVVIPFPNMLAALQVHAVDAAYLPEPYLSQAEAKIGAPELIDVNQGATENFPISGYVATQQWFDKYPKTAAAFGRTGDGYRYDYLHVGPGLADLIGACSYLHETRQLSLTDHAAMTLTLDAATTPLETGDPAGTEAADDGTLALF